jgi:hypothetical protein
MRRRVAALVVVAWAGCDASNSTSSPTTELLLTVTYSLQGIDELQVTGTALAHNRAFGPFDTKGTSVVPGCTIDLVFDPSDDGSAMVCVAGRAGGAPAASACGNFRVRAGMLSTGEIDLQSAMPDGPPPPDPLSCSNLGACCQHLLAAEQPACNAVVNSGDVAACAMRLAMLKAQNRCGD